MPVIIGLFIQRFAPKLARGIGAYSGAVLLLLIDFYAFIVLMASA